MKASYEIRVQRINEVPFESKLDAPTCMVEYWNTVIAKMPWFIPDREICVSVTVNTRYNVTGHSLVSIGCLNESIVHPREVFRAAVAMNAYES
jgi:DNA repair protein RadC